MGRGNSVGLGPGETAMVGFGGQEAISVAGAWGVRRRCRKRGQRGGPRQDRCARNP